MKKKRKLFWQRGARSHRIDREIRFISRQRRGRQWISFREIVEWLSEIDGRGVPNETARDNAYNMLQRDLLAGDFEEHGRSMVLYLHPVTPIGRMTRDRLQDALDTFPINTVRAAYLGRCWMSRRMFDRWLAKHQLPASPSRFLPTEPEAGSPQTPSQQANRRRGPKPGTVARYDEADRALFGEVSALIPQVGSAHAAALQLARDGKLKGNGTEESRAKRLERKYLKYKNSLPLVPKKSL
jgi:hypothetical protein